MLHRKFVHAETTRHGSTAYYFRRSKSEPRIRLPDDPTSKTFDEHYRAAFAGKPILGRLTLHEQDMESARQIVRRSALNALARAKSRRSDDISIDRDWVLSALDAQDYRCLMTNIVFDPTYSTEGHMKPYSPSIDRIDCRQGYHPDNCRLIVSALNIMMNDWGQTVLEDVVRGYRYVKRISVVE